MELPEIIGSSILLFTTSIILLFGFAYIVYKLKNQTRLQTRTEKIKPSSSKSIIRNDIIIEKEQEHEPDFHSIDEQIQFDKSRNVNRFEIINKIINS